MAMAEPMKTILAKYPDVGEQESVKQAIIQVMEESARPHIRVPGIAILKDKLMLDLLTQMHDGGEKFEAIPRPKAVANSAAVLAASTDWFVAFYKRTDAVKTACRGMFGHLTGDAGSPGGAGGGGVTNVNAMAAAAAAAAVKASQVSTEEDKVKQGKGQQVRNSQLDIDMATPRVATAMKAVMTNRIVTACTEESFEALCDCHAAVRQTLYMEIKVLRVKAS